MKKVFLVLSATISLMIFASCNGVDSKIDALEKACKSGNLESITKAAAALDQEQESEFTTEQLERIAKITLECANK